MAVPLVCWKPGTRVPELERFLRRPAFSPDAERVAARVLDDVRRRGDAAAARWALRFDGARIRPDRLLVTRGEIERALRSAPRDFRAAVEYARRRVERFARAGLRRDWHMATGGGGRLGERFLPLDRVGVYVPGGAAPLASTAIMTLPLARVAGVRDILACTPCGRDGAVNPLLLYAMHACGATEICRVGGVQAIGLMAFGSRRVAAVQKIVGPGGPFVTAAKRQVYGRVALDLVAGPSEIAVLADGSAEPAWAAADLLSQAEHGTGREKVLLVTTSRRLAGDVRRELELQARALPRRAAIGRVLRDGALIVIVPHLDAGVELCNRFAPEHLELLVSRPRRLLPSVRAAGAVFLGHYTPESAGDYVAGPSHVLPTGGTAAMFSGLTVDDFRRRTSVIEFTRADLKASHRALRTLAATEGLEAHARSADLRLAGRTGGA